jgi:hypothetical protein
VGIAIFQGIRSGVLALSALLLDLYISDRAAAEPHIIGHSDMVDTTASSMLCGHNPDPPEISVIANEIAMCQALDQSEGAVVQNNNPEHDVTKHHRSVICLSLIPRNCPKRHRAPQLSRLGKSSSPQLVNEGFSIEAETNGLGRSAVG